jgi:hypothetical protein
MSMDPNDPLSKNEGLGRRSFLTRAGAGAAAVAAAGVAAGMPITALADEVDGAVARESGIKAANRCKASYQYRTAMAKMARQRPLVVHTSNGDEERYANRAGSYSKGLPHDAKGDVDLAAYETLARAARTEDPADWERITLGLGRKLTSPQAGLAMDLQGADSHHVTLPPAPRFDSAEAAGEAVELYWMALARDVAFNDYATDPIVARAAGELSGLSDFRGPKVGGQVTPTTIFRDNLPGALAGPWLSQFLTLDYAYGATPVPQRNWTVVPNRDYMTTFAEWLDVQNGLDVNHVELDETPRYIRNLRDIARWVQVDQLYQAYHQAAMLLLSQNARLDPGLPLYDSTTQAPFAQCGGPAVLALVAEVSTRALKAVWYQKWFVHFRLRPEEYGGRVHNVKTGASDYPVHADVLGSAAIDEVFAKYGTYLMPMAFAEGSPTHSSYGSGHATVAGACVTALKAFFDETDTIKSPMIVNADGTELVPYDGPALTVGGELDKVAMNVAFARNGAGVHWRSDAANSLRLGEEVAICMLEEQKAAYNEDVAMSLTKFDGTRITI